MDFAVLVDHRVESKESEKRDKYQNLAWAPKIFLKELEQLEIREKVEDFLRSARIRK